MSEYIITSRQLSDTLGVGMGRINQVAKSIGIKPNRGTRNISIFTLNEANDIKNSIELRFPNRYVDSVIYVTQTFYIIPSKLNFT